MSPGHVFPENRGWVHCLAEPPSSSSPGSWADASRRDSAQGGWGTGPFIAQGSPRWGGPSDAGRQHPTSFTLPLWTSSPTGLSSSPLPLSPPCPLPVVSMDAVSRLPASPCSAPSAAAQPFVPLPRPDHSSLDHLRSQVWSRSPAWSGLEALAWVFKALAMSFLRPASVHRCLPHTLQLCPSRPPPHGDPTVDCTPSRLPPSSLWKSHLLPLPHPSVRGAECHSLNPNLGSSAASRGEEAYSLGTSETNSPAPEAAELGCGHRAGLGFSEAGPDMLTGSLCCSVGRGSRRLRKAAHGGCSVRAL